MRTKSRTAQDCKERNGPVLVRIAKPPPSPCAYFTYFAYLETSHHVKKLNPFG